MVSFHKPGSRLLLFVLLPFLVAGCTRNGGYTVDVVFMVDSVPGSGYVGAELDRCGIAWEQTKCISAVTDTFGHARFEGVPRGRYRLRTNYNVSEEVNIRVNVRSDMVLDTIWLTSYEEPNDRYANAAIQQYRQARYDGRPTGQPFRDCYNALRHALDSISLEQDTVEPYAYHVEGSDDCTSMLALLPGVRMERGWQMFVGYQGDMNGNCFLQARRGDSVTDLMTHLVVDFTEEGIWNAMLLYMSHCFLPCGWHGCYCERAVIFDAEEISGAPDIQAAEKSTPLGDLREVLSKKSVRIDNRVRILDADNAVVEAYLWSDWKGLYIERFQVGRHGNKVAFKTGKVSECQVLIPYDCELEF